MQEFISHITSALDEDRLFKLTIAKPRNKKNELRNIIFRPIQLKDEVVWSTTFRYDTKDQAKNYSSASLPAIVEDYLESHFFNADLFFEDKKISLLQSKKGAGKVLMKNEKSTIQLESHNHKKQRLISESEPYLQDLGLASTNKKIYGHAQDKFKQINKFVELISSLISDDQNIKTIVDMGCGKGYLTFGLYDYLNNVQDQSTEVKGIELRKDLVDKCNGIATKNQFKNLKFEVGSIDQYKIKSADMVIALHACDIATDMAIAKGLEADSKYIVVAPCCHKQIRKAMTKTTSTLNPILSHGILKERQAEMITDTIRALLLESKGYTVKVFEFISSEHTGKNVMITAIKTGKVNENAIDQVNDLKREFGIEEHYLEKLI